MNNKSLSALVAKQLMPFRKWLKWGSWVVNTLAFLSLVFWLFKIPIRIIGVEFDQEPVLVGLSLLFAFLNQSHRWLLNESEYSPAYALASGYVDNFLSPVITQLLEDGEKKPVIYVYKPKQISELFKNNVDRVKAEIKNNNFELSEINLSLKHARARDILVVEKSKTKKVYFDFPNTLLSLLNYVDYKVSSPDHSSSDKAKEKLTNDLVASFYDKVDELLSKVNMQSYVKYCDNELNLEFR